jgi:D-sedoheptulose 7-phosphate isomerase
MNAEGRDASRGPGIPRGESSAEARDQAGRLLEQALLELEAVPRTLAADLARAADAVARALAGGRKVLACGNGGSAADAEHIATELGGRFGRERRALPAVALTTNAAALTAIANDYGYEAVFRRQIEGLGQEGDVLIALTTSGASANILEAVRAARERGMVTIGFTGAGGTAFAAECDIPLVAPSTVTARVQEAHLVLYHALCALVERALFDGGGRR